MNPVNKIVYFAKGKRIKSVKSVLFFSFIQRMLIGTVSNIIGPLIPLIARDLEVGLDYIGLTISIGTFALLITSISTGFLLEVFGYKKIIFGGGLLIALGCLGLMFSYSYIIFAVAYIVFQLGVGILSVATLSMVGNHYFENKSKSILVVNIGLTSGSFIAPLLVSLIVYIGYSWKSLFLYFIVPQVLLVVVLIFLKTSLKDKNVISFKNFVNTNKVIASHPYIILCCFISFLYISVMQIFYTWFTSYFSTLNIGIETSSVFKKFCDKVYR